jgi:hypothetical protein
VQIDVDQLAFLLTTVNPMRVDKMLRDVNLV